MPDMIKPFRISSQSIDVDMLGEKSSQPEIGRWQPGKPVSKISNGRPKLGIGNMTSLL